ncbi:MAG TPA: Ig-like domain repeat protein [Tepidisphaeraceae bacterium]|jgi:parallel beta-helix repeat protein|nr:Ig-like domain repeat protein [Tepidisphaeraceae bacterium]
MHAKLLEALEARTLFSVFVVNNTADAGPGSLRQAILDANLNPGADAVSFAIPQPAGQTLVQTISLAAALPAVTDPLSLDATTETGYHAAPLIELRGSLADAGAAGIELAAPGCTVAGFVINGFSGDGATVDAGADGAILRNNYIGTDSTGALAAGNGGNGISVFANSAQVLNNVVSANSASGVYLESSTGSTVAGNFIGTNAAGSFTTDALGASLGNANAGVFLDFGCASDTVGGATAAAGNVISGNANTGITVQTSGTDPELIQGNFIGTNAAGAAALPNNTGGVLLNSPNTQVTNNLISGNSGYGLKLTDGSTLQGNKIGTDASGKNALPNQADGVFVFGSGNSITGNSISYNYRNGVNVFTGSGNVVRQNSIYLNQWWGIDLGNDGVTANDSSGHENGPNLFQNFPVLTTVTRTATTITLSGTLDSLAAGPFTIDFYTSTAPDSSGFGQGEIYLGSTTVTLDASGHGTFTATFAGPAASQTAVTATATDADGNTSEFAMSQALPPAPAPAPLPAATTTTLGTSSASATAGQAVTWKAVITSGVAGSPTGTVQFFDGTTLLATVTVANGSAAFTSSALSVASHSMTAVYSGDSAYAASTSAVLTQVVVSPAVSLATISGHAYTDLTGNGLTADDTAMAGVTVKLYADKNNNGVLDAADGAALATAVTDAKGAYAFTNLTAGRYFVQEMLPTGYLVTMPVQGDTYTTSVSGATTVSTDNFDNLKTSNTKVNAAALENILVQRLTIELRTADLREATKTIAALLRVFFLGHA